MVFLKDSKKRQLTTLTKLLSKGKKVDQAAISANSLTQRKSIKR